MKRFRYGFTLIELLVVIGLIAVLAGVLGLALGRGNSGAALQSSQATLQGVFASARGQAAINQDTAYVVLNIDPSDPERFLREFYIILDSTNKPVGNPITLSQGIYVVPRSTGDTYGGVVSFQGDWTNRVSTAFLGDNPRTYTGITGTFARVRGITDRGTTTGNGDVILAPAERQGEQSLVFNNPEAVRGVAISNYGVLTFLNSAEAMQ